MKNIKGALFTLIALLILSMPSYANEYNLNYKPYLYPDIYLKCGNAQAESDIAKCAVSEITKALGYLGEIEAQYKKSNSYEKSSVNWLKFVDSTCEFETERFNGGMGSRRFSECKLSLIIYRINIIEKFIACEKNEKCADDIASFSKIITSK